MPPDLDNAQSPGLLRRLAAIGYDLLLVIALLITGAALVVLPVGMIFGISGEALSSNPVYQLYLLALILGFYIGFWMRGGQTLGMRAWRILLVRNNGEPLRLRDALLRLLWASLSWSALGIGYLWVLFDREGMAWHDRLSRTRMVMLEKRKRR